MFIFVCLFLLTGCAGSVGIFSGEPGHVYFVCVSPLCGVPCRYNFYLWTLVVWAAGLYGFSFLSGRYGTVRLVRERWSVFLLLSSVICPFFWRLGVGGKGFLCHIFFSGSS